MKISTGLVCVLLLTAALAGCGDDGLDEAPLPTEADEAGFEEGPPLATGKADGSTEGPAYGPLPAGVAFEAALQVFFAPDDPVISVELGLIEEVVKARRGESGTFAEGENPFRIRYAVYNLRNPLIVAALAGAEDAGVDVQILMESDQLDPARTWNTGDETLVARGFELVEDHRALSTDTRRSADLIGIKKSGLMHTKMRIFSTPAGEKVLSGSMNPGDHAVFNEESAHVITDPKIIKRYAAAFEAIRDAEPLSNTWEDGAAVNVLFTPVKDGPRAGGQILSWLEQEQEQILLMVFSLRNISGAGADADLVEVLTRKAAAGVPVYVITDRKQSDGVDADGKPMFRDDDTEDKLREGGVHVYEATNRSTPFTAMHHKTAVLGRSRLRVITDAANWTFSGLGSSTRVSRNVESVLFIDAEALDGGWTGRRYLAQWLRVAARYAQQSADRDGEPTFGELEEALLGQRGWPTVPVHFEAVVDFTQPGEEVEVRGDHEILGVWGGGAHRLTTDGDSFPTWRSLEPAALPLGGAVDYKFVVTSGLRGKDTVWERGENRRLESIAPTPWVDGVEVHGVFRR